LKVVGRGAELLPRDVAAAVDATGAVPSIEPHLADASVVVIPLRAGGGTRLKLLEALAWGRPVVATSKGAEGVAVEPGSDLLIADAAAAFASGTYQLWHDHARASRMAAAGRIVGASFDWSKVAQGFVRIVAGVAGA
jgi:glycosyltransferase involved in cell wall biosynthesis